MAETKIQEAGYAYEEISRIFVINFTRSYTRLPKTFTQK